MTSKHIWILKIFSGTQWSVGGTSRDPPSDLRPPAPPALESSGSGDLGHFQHCLSQDISGAITRQSPRKRRERERVLTSGHLWHCFQVNSGLQGPMCSSPVICQVATGAGKSAIVRKSRISGVRYPFVRSACSMETAWQVGTQVGPVGTHSSFLRLSITTSAGRRSGRMSISGLRWS